MNRLSGEHSPYLLQHAHNPVHWQPWGDAAFAEAKARDVPIFLSIGYAACHWCHVMERESFEDPAVAAFLNQHFVSIKVDREERPDVDAIYLEALHSMGQQGGWPASLWLDHDRQPFYGGTYFPPQAAFGRPAFIDLLRALHRSWTGDRARLSAQAQRLVQLLREANRPSTSSAWPKDPALTCVQALTQGWDEDEFGWGQGHKFPMPCRYELLLAWGLLGPSPDSLATLHQGLDAMERGGLHDPLGGGFHRYCVDPGWVVPHFEKMLYDNAQLLRLYARAASALRHERYAQVARDTATWLIREMQDPDGGFYASQDADSGGEEGSYYVWTPEELQLLLPPDQARLFAQAYGVTPRGNFEGRTVLTRRGPQDPESAPLRAARETLRKARNKRTRPPTDTKLVTAWNGLSIGALATAGRLLGEPAFVGAAARAADRWLLAQIPDGALPRTLAPGAPAGVLEDYAFLGEGLLDLYEADPDPRWLLGAERVARALLSRFGEASGALMRSEPSSALLFRQLEITEGAEPSGYARALELLFRLTVYGSPVCDRARIEAALGAVAAEWSARPAACPGLAWVAERLSRPSRECVIATPAPEHPALPGLLSVWNRRWRPDTVLALSCPDWEPGLEHLAALRRKRPAPDGPRVFVCLDKVCGLPVRTAEAMERELDQSSDSPQ